MTSTSSVLRPRPNREATWLLDQGRKRKQARRGLPPAIAAVVDKGPSQCAFRAPLRRWPPRGPGRVNAGKRIDVSVEDILGRQRINMIASARHEAIWRVREGTDWSPPRVGQFFAKRDHTTVLHSIRRMEDRATRDLELRASMIGIERGCAAQRRSLTH